MMTLTLRHPSVVAFVCVYVSMATGYTLTHTHTPHQPVSIVGEFNLKERRAVNEGRGEELINAAR